METKLTTRATVPDQNGNPDARCYKAGAEYDFELTLLMGTAIVGGFTGKTAPDISLGLPPADTLWVSCKVP